MDQAIKFEKTNFIKNIWNKKPQLYKRPLHWNFELEINEISSIALEEDNVSRLIELPDNKLENLKYTQGPFSIDELSKLNEATPWALMIQNLEEYFSELTHIKSTFDFIPEEIREDIMGVICGPNGTTGPHIDRYSVFIIPILGEKTWSIESSETNEKDVDKRLLPNDDLKILKDFNSENKFTVKEDEFLYIPPGFAHHAVSNELSLSLSYGVKTPRTQIILDVLYTRLIEKIHTDNRVNLRLSASGSLEFHQIESMSPLLKALIDENPEINLSEIVTQARQWEGF